MDLSRKYMAPFYAPFYEKMMWQLCFVLISNKLCVTVVISNNLWGNELFKLYLLLQLLISG